MEDFCTATPLRTEVRAPTAGLRPNAPSSVPVFRLPPLLQSIPFRFNLNSEVGEHTLTGVDGRASRRPFARRIVSNARSFSEIGINRHAIGLSPLLRLWRVARRNAGLQTRSGVQPTGSVARATLTRTLEPFWCDRVFREGAENSDRGGLGPLFHFRVQTKISFHRPSPVQILRLPHQEMRRLQQQRQSRTNDFRVN